MTEFVNFANIKVGRQKRWRLIRVLLYMNTTSVLIEETTSEVHRRVTGRRVQP